MHVVSNVVRRGEEMFCDCSPGTPGGGGGYSQNNWVGVCGPLLQNPNPIYDQNLRFSLPYL